MGIPETETMHPALLTPPLSEDELPLYEELKLASPLETCEYDDAAVFERKMGDTELSYFLPSRQSGVNDMYALLFPFVRCNLPA